MILRDLARAVRVLLSVVAAGIVVWAFWDVGKRAWETHQARAQRPINLTILHWGNPAEERIVRDLVAGFEAQNPRVHVTRIGVGDYSNFHPKLKTMIAAGQPPDCFYQPPDILPTLADFKLIEPLDPWIAKEDPVWLADFFPILRQAFKMDPKTGLFGEGPTWALPKDFTTTVFYFNVGLFDAAGVDWRNIQKNGWTWERFGQEMKKINALRERPEFKGREIYGTFINLGSETFRTILWSYGGEFFQTLPDGKPDFRNLALGTPESLAAIEMITQMRLRDHTAFNSSGIAKDGGQEFLNGNIGCYGSIGRWMVPTYKSIANFKWDCLPVPYAKQKASMIHYTGWAMSSTCSNKDEAYKLIHYLCGQEGQVQQARAGLSLPARMSVAYGDDFLRPWLFPMADPTDPPVPPHNSQAFVDAIQWARLPQVPKQIEWRQILEDSIDRAIKTGQETPAQAAAHTQRNWLAELDSPLRGKDWSPMPWKSILWITAAGVFLFAGTLWSWARRERLGVLDRQHQRAGWMFILPWVIGFLALTLGPMLMSLLLSTSRWNGMSSLAHADYVGTANFRQLFKHDATFVQSLKVTAYYVLLAVPVLQIAALAIALLMNARLRGIAFFRTLVFLPSVISGVAMAVVWLHLFNDGYGPINQLLRPIASIFGTRPPNWFGVDVHSTPPTNDAAVWAVPALVIMGLWGVGGGMIIYLAGLKGIPESLYEAATIDGAGPARRFWNVTLPMLSPLIFFNLVMGIIGSFQIFTQAYVMTGPGPDNATLFYVLNLYRQAFVFHNMGYASAMAWVLFVIVLVLTIAIFRGSRRLVYYEGLKA